MNSELTTENGNDDISMRMEESRPRILKAIQDNPGITKVELAAKTGLASGTIAHHLCKLGKAKRIRAVRVGRYLHIATPNFMKRTGGLDVLAAPLARKIMEHVAAAGFPSGPTEISRRTSTTARRVQGQLDRLVKAGLLKPDRGYHPRYRVTSRANEALKFLRSRRRSEPAIQQVGMNSVIAPIADAGREPTSQFVDETHERDERH